MLDNVQNWIDFILSVRKFQENKNSFFSNELLELMDNHLDIKHSLIIVFDNELFVKSFSHNIPKALNDAYKEYYFVENYHPHYVKQNWNDLIIGTDLIPIEEYYENYYVKFVYEKSGFNYVASMPFDKFYIAIYKTKEDGDFTALERDKLRNLYKLLYSEFVQYVSVVELENTNLVNNRIFDLLNVGVITFNENKEVKFYNQKSLDFINELCDRLNVYTLYSDISERVKIPAQSASTDNEVIFNNFIMKFIYDFNSITFKRSLTIIIKDREVGSYDPRFDSLSNRELEIITCLSKGMSYQDTADALYISINTARTHLKNIYKKLDLNNQRSLLSKFNEYKTNAQNK